MKDMKRQTRDIHKNRFELMCECWRKIEYPIILQQKIQEAPHLMLNNKEKSF
jgi:hypothetical protein